MCFVFLSSFLSFCLSVFRCLPRTHVNNTRMRACVRSRLLIGDELADEEETQRRKPRVTSAGTVKYNWHQSGKNNGGFGGGLATFAEDEEDEDEEDDDDEEEEDQDGKTGSKADKRAKVSFVNHDTDDNNNGDGSSDEGGNSSASSSRSSGRKSAGSMASSSSLRASKKRSNSNDGDDDIGNGFGDGAGSGGSRSLSSSNSSRKPYERSDGEYWSRFLRGFKGAGIIGVSVVFAHTCTHACMHEYSSSQKQYF